MLINILADPGPWSEDIDTLINCLIGAYKDNLTLWKVTIDGEIYNPFDNPLPSKELLMCCYFNIGIDAEIGASKIIIFIIILIYIAVERNRSRSKCMNALIYIAVGITKIFDCRRHPNR